MLMFSLNQMTLRKKTIDISVRCVPKSEQTKKREKTRNNKSWFTSS